MVEWLKSKINYLDVMTLWKNLIFKSINWMKIMGFYQNARNSYWFQKNSQNLSLSPLKLLIHKERERELIDQLFDQETIKKLRKKINWLAN